MRISAQWPSSDFGMVPYKGPCFDSKFAISFAAESASLFKERRSMAAEEVVEPPVISSAEVNLGQLVESEPVERLTLDFSLS